MVRRTAKNTPARKRGRGNISLSALQRPACPLPAWQPQPTDLTAQTCTRVSCAEPSRLRAAHPSRLELWLCAVCVFPPHNMRTLAGKVEESAGRTSVQAGPRRSRAPAQQQTSGRRHSALPTHCPPGSRNPPTSRPEVQTLAGKVEESAGRTSVQAGPRRSRAHGKK